MKKICFICFVELCIKFEIELIFIAINANRLSELATFIADAEKGLTQPLREGDLKKLISVMTWLQQVKDRQVATDNMFEPIKKYIELLKMYDYELPESVFVQLEGITFKVLTVCME